MVTLESVVGPLNPEQLQAIAGLYGQHDPKYAQRPYLERLYNGNPSGPSGHVFAHAPDGTPVGHYSLIPTPLCAQGSVRAGAKGEAFFIAPEHRSARIESGVPLGIALLSQAFALARAQGWDVVHIVTSDEIGKLARLCGCRPVPLAVPQHVHMLNQPFALPDPANRRPALLWAASQAARALALTAAPLRLRPDLALNITTPTPEHLAHAAALPDCDPHRWSVLTDPAWLSWFGDHFERVERAADPHDNALIGYNLAPAQEAWVVALNIPADRPLVAVRILAHAIDQARQRGASSLRLTDAMVHGNLALTFAAKRLGFIPHTTQIPFFVHTRDRYFHKPEHLAWGPQFSLFF